MVVLTGCLCLKNGWNVLAGYKLRITVDFYEEYNCGQHIRSQVFV